MPVQASYRMVVLFEDEVRAAARALADVLTLPDDAPADDFNAAATKALQMCGMALAGAEDDQAVLVLSRKPSPPTGGA